MNMSVHMSIHLSIHMSTNMSVQMFIHVSICMFVYMSVLQVSKVYIYARTDEATQSLALAEVWHDNLYRPHLYWSELHRPCLYTCA